MSLELFNIELIRPLFQFVTQIDSETRFMKFSIPDYMQINTDLCLQYFMADASMSWERGDTPSSFNRTFQGTVIDKEVFMLIHQEYHKNWDLGDFSISLKPCKP